MSNTYQQLSFVEIKHKLPKDCWAYERNEKNNGEFENEQVLYFTGDALLGHLNLDDVLGLQEKGEADFIFLVLVEGNLTVGNYIYNQDTDGATGLIVLGNLTAKNIVVGGQEIYITGNLQISELFWGDYNHGSLKANGNIALHTFIATDYHFDADRFRNKDRVAVRHWLWDEQDVLDNTTLTELLDEECLIPDDEDDPIIDRGKMLEYFEAGTPVIKTTAEEPIPFVFENRLFNDANLQRLLQSPLFRDAPINEADGTQTIEYWRDKDFKRVTIIKGDPYAIRVYFQQADKAFLVGYAPVTGDGVSDQTPKCRIGTAVRTIFDDFSKDVNSHWQEFNPAIPGHRDFGPMAEVFWDKLLNEWSEMEYWQNKFLQTVSPKKLAEILALPVVKQKYKRDAEELWEGFYNWVFIQGDDKEGDNPCISIFKQLTSRDGDEEEDFETYHFEPQATSGNHVRTALQTTDNGDYDSYPVSVDEVEKYRNAIRYFEIMYRRMHQLNKEYLEG